MAQGRPDIPADLKRRVMMEAGYRCAIPTCRSHPCAIDHIDDWAKVKEHRFENLIALCHQCHARKGNKPGQIDRKALLGYKANLSTLNAMYNDIERRMLETFAERHNEGEPWGVIELDYRLHFMVSRLFDDGRIEVVRDAMASVFGAVTSVHYGITASGIELVETMIAARPVMVREDDAEIPEF
ncbi:HNH endonuclease [Catellatospora paridis]|uniref:HNH endonuclease n=1 Tax=Catellatospora paridis TaxID=1617086 RepID=UPI0012D40F9E|nr:HNH endonuclease signature motif containing protein [Catellatospora paridis]